MYAARSWVHTSALTQPLNSQTSNKIWYELSQNSEDKADRDLEMKITGMETDKSHVRRLKSRYMSFVITHKEGPQDALVTANKTDSLSNENQSFLTRQNL